MKKQGRCASLLFHVCPTCFFPGPWREIRQYSASFSDPSNRAEEHLFDDVADVADKEAFKAQFMELGQACLDTLRR